MITELTELQKEAALGKVRVAVPDCDDYSGAIIVESIDAYMYRFCRPIPESLEAWRKARGE